MAIVYTPKALLRIVLMALHTAWVVLFQTLLLPFHKGKYSYYTPQAWGKGINLFFGIKLEVVGKPITDRQVLYVSNHLSYLDIPTLGSCLRGSFVARGDMSRWPIVGYMARMQQTIFISRKREDAEKGKRQLEEQLSKKANIIIFAEGTSSDGASVLPFKSSLFSLALENPTGKPLLVQPVTISLLSANGYPASKTETRDFYAWHRDMTLLPHIWAVAKGRGAHLRIEFHEPRDAKNYDDRKTLCNDCYNDVKNGLILPEPDTTLTEDT